MPKFIMLIGSPCSGKSTWVKNNIREEVVILSTDNLIEREAEKIGMTYSEAFDVVDFKALEREMFDTMDDAMKNGHDIVLDRTNMSDKQRAKILKKVDESYDKVAVVFQTPLEIVLERNVKRAEETGKNIPVFVIKSMFNNFVEPTVEEGFDHIIHVYV